MGSKEGLARLWEEVDAGFRICETCLGTGKEKIGERVTDEGVHQFWEGPCSNPDCGLKKDTPEETS